MTAFTHYWKNDTFEQMRDGGYDGEPLDHTAGNTFANAGVKKGDAVYVITVIKGNFFLVGRMIVSQIVHSDAEAARLLGYDVWPAEDHLIAGKNECSPMRFRRRVPIEIVNQLRFESADRPKPLVFKSPGRLDQQTLRGVRKLTRSSAALLDSILEQ
ncbi:MAG TPA: hypothetical protein VJ840_17935 [Gemmatimonadaceae bacterium]|nr:hypothetical protein [Gemmatimonadaceae bacterium]